MMNYEITLFGRINWTTYGLKTITVQKAIEIIQNGTYIIKDSKDSKIYCTLKEITNYMQYSPKGIDLQVIKSQFLPAVTFNGVYNNGIVKYSNITALDFDHLPSQEEFSDLYLRLSVTPCVGWIFRTPSGHGLKALILHDNTNPKMHGNMYQQLMQMFQTPYIKTDSKCKDLSRRNYLCYDPNVWINPKPIPYHFIYDDYEQSVKESKIKKNKKHKEYNKSIVVSSIPSDASIMNLLKSRCKRFHPNYLKEGHRRDGVYWFGTQSGKAGVDYSYGLEYVQELYQSRDIILTKGGLFSKDEVTENYTNGYETENYDEYYRKEFIIKKR